MPRQKTYTKECREIDKALSLFTEDMRFRLYEKAAQGYRGWDDPFYADHIAKDLKADAFIQHLDQDCLHLHDIANRAMMLWWQRYHNANSSLNELNQRIEL